MTLEYFVTPRLRGERLTEAHLPDVRRLQSDPDVMALLGGVRDAVQTAEYLERNLAHWDRYGHGVYIVRALDTDLVAGLGCLRHLKLDEQNEIEIGYLLFPVHWGQGLATEIAGACRDLGFTLTGVESLVAVTHPDNRASQRVMEHVGMVHERETLLDGRPVVVYRGYRAWRVDG
jgi:RimJ/RimL family protein N-acetyltransferase